MLVKGMCDENEQRWEAMVGLGGAVLLGRVYYAGRRRQLEKEKLVLRVRHRLK